MKMPCSTVPENVDPLEAQLAYELLWEFGEDGRYAIELFGGPGFVRTLLTMK